MVRYDTNTSAALHLPSSLFLPDLSELDHILLQQPTPDLMFFLETSGKAGQAANQTQSAE